MSEELLPCPFCGNHPSISDETTAEGIVVFVHCEYCATHERDVTAYSTAWDDNEAEQDAIWKWNRRAYPPEVQEALEKQKQKKPAGVLRKDGFLLGLCRVCGGIIDNGHRFCRSCGQKVNWSDYE